VEHLQAGNGQAKGGGNPVLEGMEIANVMLFEELEDIVRGVKRGVAGGTVGQNTNPDRGMAGNSLAAAILSLLLPSWKQTSELDLEMVEYSKWSVHRSLCFERKRRHLLDVLLSLAADAKGVEVHLELEDTMASGVNENEAGSIVRACD